MAYVVLLASNPYRRSGTVYRLGLYPTREDAERYAASVVQYLKGLGFKAQSSPDGFDLVKDHQNHVFLAIVQE